MMVKYKTGERDHRSADVHRPLQIGGSGDLRQAHASPWSRRPRSGRHAGSERINVGRDGVVRNSGGG